MEIATDPTLILIECRNDRPKREREEARKPAQEQAKKQAMLESKTAAPSKREDKASVAEIAKHEEKSINSFFDSLRIHRTYHRS